MSRPKALLIIVVWTIACYWQVLFFDFLGWDDPIHFLDNPHVLSLSPDNILKIFRATVSQMYIPLTVLSYAVEYHFFEFNPMIFHFHNILLHAGVAILVFFFSSQCGLNRNASLIAALIFAIHPMHVESVAWITERKDVLYALFYMASLCSYGAYLKSKTFKMYGLSLLCGLLSILAKPMALSLPLVLFLCDWIHGRKINLRVLAEKVPFFLYSVAIACVTFTSVKEQILTKNVWEDILFGLWTFSFYISKFILPVRLVPIYAAPEPVHPGNPALLLPILFVVFLGGLLFVWRHKRWYVFAFLLYIAQIFFLLRFHDRLGAHVVADRFMYLPSIGFCLLFGYLFDKLINAPDNQKLPRRRLMIRASLVIYLVSLSVVTLLQAQIWKNDLTLWSREIRYNPRNALAYHNRGNALMDQEKYGPAISDYRKALQINPGRATTYSNLGVVFTEQSNFQMALEVFNKALSIDPNYSAAFVNRGNLFRIQGKLAEALKDYDRALLYEEQEPIIRALAYAEKGHTLFLLKDYSMARQNVGRALAIFPDLVKALNYREMIDEADGN